MTTSKLATLAVTATASIDNVLLLFAKELEAHRELINGLETQILNLQAREMVADVSNDYNIESRFDRIEARLDMIEKVAQGSTHSITNDIESRFERLMTQIESVGHSGDQDTREINRRLDCIDCILEDKLDSMDLDERVGEALQNVTFTVTVE